MQTHLAAVTRNTSDALARARYLCIAAHRVVDEAHTLYQAARDCSAVARHSRLDCRHSRELWTDLRTAAGLVVRCAYCKRIRAHDGDWFNVGPSIDRALRRMDILLVSHGICADCVALYFPACGPASGGARKPSPAQMPRP